MHVVQINVVNAESLQAALDSLLHILRRSVNHETLIANPYSKLRCQEDILTALRVQFEPLSDKVLAIAINISCIPVGTAEFPGAIEDLETIFIGSEDVSE
ncbi:hypothetical protein HG530_006174 [Fusarium avenaceum]|nr:hypothetical protein HG530_006174 [Fusarium avenaceum]